MISHKTVINKKNPKHLEAFSTGNCKT